MKQICKRLIKEERGNALVLVVCAMGAMLALLGLVIDGGHLFMTKSHLQKTANAAALSGAQEIMNNEAAVHQVVDEVLAAHKEQDSLLQATIVNNRQLHVELERNVPLFFSSLFGMEAVALNVDAKAGLQPMGKTTGAVPLGIDESVNLIFGETYTLKVDAGESTAGNFGVLALDGPGAKTYLETLTYGFDNELKIGDVLPTQTGNIAGPTQSGIDYRIDHCPYPVGEIQHRDCSRVMKVIVYQPYEMATNQMKSVKVTGFAFFYVTERMNNTDDSIKGIFIRRAGDGIAGAVGTPDRGAYAIRLE